MDKVGDENAPRLECWVYLQVIDKAWKNHLLGMDALKDSVSLRGYGQRDPLQEYKKEGYRLFQTMIARINEETATALIQLEIPDELETPDLQEPDESAMQMQHQQQEAFQQQPQANGAGGSGDDGMIYHGSRAGHDDEPQQEQQQVETYRRETAKVGRNDPCPCGSGKKFKKCHGRPGADAAEGMHA